MDKVKILQVIRERRKELGLSQGDIAQKLGVSQGQYSSYEVGRSEMSLDKFLEINQLLNLRLADFEANPEISNNAKKQLIEKLSQVIQTF